MGQRRLIVTDPKAIAHCWAKNYTYRKTKTSEQGTLLLTGKGLLWANGDNHKRQRRTLNTAFTNAAVRDLVFVFFESAYKTKIAWDTEISRSPEGEAIIDVTKWMCCISLDSIGIAGFNHDFGSLRGEQSALKKAFDAVANAPKRGADRILFLLAFAIPVLLKVPTEHKARILSMTAKMHVIAENLLQSSRADQEKGIIGSSGRTIIGALIRAENAEAKSSLSKEEIVAQMRTLIIAGSETTSVVLTWALIELAFNPEKQERLRREITGTASSEPSYEQLTSELPYLDAIFRETLRLHSPVEQNHRLTLDEDVIPLSEPVTTATGETVDSIKVGAGLPITMPTRSINRSEAIWGSDAKEFKPERWLNEAELPSTVKEMPGYHHLMSFIDGPRICIGRLFAAAEFKAVLSVLVRNYEFQMRDGLQTRIGKSVSLFTRPKVEGEEGPAVPMRIRQISV